jgi:hypothetical protein
MLDGGLAYTTNYISERSSYRMLLGWLQHQLYTSIIHLAQDMLYLIIIKAAMCLLEFPTTIEFSQSNCKYEFEGRQDYMIRNQLIYRCYSKFVMLYSISWSCFIVQSISLSCKASTVSCSACFHEAIEIW